MFHFNHNVVVYRFQETYLHFIIDAPNYIYTVYISLSNID